MKRVLAFLAVAAILLSCGCGKQTSANTIESTDNAAAVQTTVQPAPEDDLALPAENADGSTTAPVLAGDMAAQTTAFQQAPILQMMEQAQNNPQPEQTTAPTTQPEQTTAPTTQSQEDAQNAQPEQTTAPTTTTTKPPETTATPVQTAELLQSAVMQPINSGTYTMTISAFGKDHSSSDKLSKIVRGGETAYYLTIPDANATYKVFPANGKYYLATPTKYCELTSDQYNKVCSFFNNAFCNFSSLKFQSSETVREGLKKYTCEHFTLGGSDLTLWYQNGRLVKLQMGDEYLPMTVSAGADNGYFTLSPELEQVDYETMEALVNLAGAFFGE